MRIRELIELLGEDVITSSGDIAFIPAGIANDHRKSVQGALFVCVKGFVADGHDFAAAAIANGASALISQKPFDDLGIPPASRNKIHAFAQVRDTRRALAAASHLFYGEPTKKLLLTGITGTKGKTTIVYMIRAILQAAGFKPGMIGTVENDIGGEINTSAETTPGAVELAGYFSKMHDRGCGHAVMEVSSQGLALSRVDYCDFDIGVFTNFYNDHISPNEHASMEEYFAAKLKLFSMCKKVAVNADINEYGAVRDAFIRRAGGGAGEGAEAGAGAGAETFISFSADEEGMNRDAANVRASRIEPIRDADGNTRASMRFHVETPWFSDTMTVGLPGRYNVSNALAAISVCGLLGVNQRAISEGLRNIEVRGRTQAVNEGQDFSVLIDYAHNAASLETLLQTLREYNYKTITTVFGCGGNRARERRYDMGGVSGRYSDLTIVTSDNPRMEAPEAIMADIETGLRRTDGRYIMIEDRREAIGYAIKNASAGTLVLIAGKGHETTQTFADKIIPFDDAEVAREHLRVML